MNPTPDPDFDPAAIEASLRSLAPSRPAIDRDRILFEAGRASAGARSRPAWPALAAAAGFALVAGVEGALLATRPSARVVERVVVVGEPAPHPAAPPAAPVASRPPAPPAALAGVGLGRAEHDRMAARLIRYGLDGLDAPRPLGRLAPDADARSARRLLRELDSIPGIGDPS